MLRAIVPCLCGFVLWGCGARTGLSLSGGDGGLTEADADADIDGDAADADPEDLQVQARTCWFQEGREPGMDRFVIYAEDPEQELCVTVQISTPAGAGFDIALPDEWHVMHAEVNQLMSGCPRGCGGWTGVFSQQGEGTIDFGPDVGTYAPCSVSVDVRFFFESDERWVPEVVELAASDVPVVGACD